MQTVNLSFVLEQMLTHQVVLQTCCFEDFMQFTVITLQRCLESEA